MSLVETEQVLVVPTSLFHRLGYFQGFSRDVHQYLDELLSPRHTSYRSRGEMEDDPRFKQLIPYVIFEHVNLGNVIEVFSYTRGRGQGDRRLHAKRSVGIGGHISSIDESARGDLHPYEEGLARELAEEVSIDTPYQQRLAGLINDDETDVGKVHLGVVHIFTVETPAITPREREIMHAGFTPVRDLLRDLDGFESWSQICLRALYDEQ